MRHLAPRVTGHSNNKCASIFFFFFFFFFFFTHFFNVNANVVVTEPVKLLMYTSFLFNNSTFCLFLFVCLLLLFVVFGGFVVCCFVFSDEIRKR